MENNEQIKLKHYQEIQDKLNDLGFHNFDDLVNGYLEIRQKYSELETEHSEISEDYHDLCRRFC